MSFEKNGYELVKGVVSKDVLELLQKQFALLRDIQEDRIFNPPALPLPRNLNDLYGKSYNAYAPHFFEVLLEILKKQVEDVVGKKLLPCYSYGRIYYTGSSLHKHVDRNECEYSVTLTIKNDVENGPWPIYFEQFDGKETSLLLDEGDMIVYKGSKLPHWRNTFSGKEHMQTFLHYVDEFGQYKQYAYDGRLGLGLS